MDLRLAMWLLAGAIICLSGWYFESFFSTAVPLAFWVYAFVFTDWIVR